MPAQAPKNKNDGLYRVLIVDDNRGDVNLTLDRLSEAHATAIASTVATTLTEAIEKVKESPFDIVILDLNLPDSRGLETYREFREKSFSTVPVVIVSGLVSKELREECLREGVHKVISKDDLRHPLFAMSVMYVIERDRAQEQRRQMEKLLDTNPDAVVVVDAHGIVQYANTPAFHMMGAGSGGLLKQPFPFPISRDKNVEIRIPQKEGESLFGELRVVEFLRHGEPSFLVTIRDISEQKKMEMQLLLSDRMVSIGTLAAGVAHEINNPLASLIGNLEMASDKIQKLHSNGVHVQNLLEEMRDAQEAADRVQSIVRDLKVFSRPEDETIEPVDIHRVMDSTLRMAQNEIRHRAKIIKEYGKAPYVEANKSRLGQVLLNLLVNAAQALPTDRYNDNEVRITTKKNERGNAVIQVTDTGSGMPPHVQRRIFTPFFTTKPEGKGTGLGLAICHRIITSFHGTISFQSQEGKGTTFTIELPPSARVPFTQEEASYQPKDCSREAPTDAQILVIDDESIIIRLLQRALGQEHNVLGLTDATEALRHLEEGNVFDIIFCDLMMPTMTGMAFYDVIKKWGKGLEETIVFMTGGAFTEEARTFLTQVNNPHISKPFDLKELKSLVEEKMGAATD